MDNTEFTTKREALGFTKDRLAGILGVTIRTIYNYESGKRTIPKHVDVILTQKLAEQDYLKKIRTGY